MLIALSFLFGFATADPVEYDVIVYGSTPSGIAAAVAAADEGQTVLLIEPTARIGGMLTNGLSHTDYHSYDGLSGLFLDFSQRVAQYYETKYGAESQQVEECYRGTFGEPSVNLLVLQQMIAAHDSIRLITNMPIHKVSVTASNKDNTSISMIQCRNVNRNDSTIFHAKVYIDASYEGDLMAMAGVPWTSGREAGSVYDESLAPAMADEQLQAYNFRFCMTRDPNNRVMPKAPQGYNRADYLPVLDILQSGKLKTVFGYPNDCIFKAHLPPLPNGKYDINDVSHGIIRLSLPGKNLGWPDGDAKTRQRIFDEHLRDNVGLLYFLQNDDSVPKKYRDEARQWGMCKDEFTETEHLPAQLYIREARRMIGLYIYTQKDCERLSNDARSILHYDAIAMGEYGNNCHGTFHEGPRYGGRHTGEFYNPVPPYQIPYGVIVPKNVTNLLVCGAVSSSHVGFCALRLEPIWMSLGEAAGIAASIAATDKLNVQAVPVAKVQKRLHKHGSSTFYASDLLPGNPSYEAVQWWGTLGGFHGIEPPAAQVRGKSITSQYTESYPNHEVKLNAVLDKTLYERWQKLAENEGISSALLPRFDGKLTCGEWLNAAWRLR